MALSIGSQLSLQSALYGQLLPAPRAASSLSNAIAEQFYAQQGSLILNRTPSTTRAILYQSTLQHAVDLERSAWALQGRPGHDALLSERTFFSSDATKVRGTVGAAWSRPTNPAGLRVEVFSTFAGKPQTVISNTADVSGSWSGPRSVQGFRLSVGGSDHDLSVDTTLLTTTGQVLRGIAGAINAKAGSTGVVATVKSIDGSAYLDVTSDGSVAQTFSLTDTGGTLLATVGATSGTTANPSAGTGGVLGPEAMIRYRIDNGPVQTVAASAPKVELTGQSTGTTLWLLDHTATGPVTVSVIATPPEPSRASPTEAIDAFVSRWNALFSLATTNPSELTTPIAHALDSAVGSQVSALEGIGITRSAADGTFSVDTDQLAAYLDADPANPGRVQQLLTGPAGLVTTASRITQDFVRAPARYLTHPQNPVAAYALRWMTYYETRGQLMNTFG